jgi:hypothetical protein
MAAEDLAPADGAPNDLAAHWRPWAPAEVARLLAGVTAPWYVAGGWALDLFRGAQTRPHGDLEIGVPESEFGQVSRALAGYTFEVAGDGRLWNVDGPAFGRFHQVWVSEAAADLPLGRAFRLDVMREPAAGGQWACRRDTGIVLPYDQVIQHDSAGIPYLAPELALLFKAKHRRPKDDADFAAALPLLGPKARARLRATLTQVHPGHSWIGAL